MPGLPVLHPRFFQVQKAQGEVHMAVVKLMEEHDLTYPETMGILARIQADVAKYAVQMERHGPNSDKRTDEA